MKKENISDFKAILFCIVMFILIVIFKWHSITMLDNLFLFVLYGPFLLIIFVVLIAFLCLSVGTSIKHFKGSGNMLSFAPILINVITIGILLFPGIDTTIQQKFERNYEKRNEIVDKIKNEKIQGDYLGNYILEDKDKKLSDTGELHIYQNDENGIVIAFWDFRGMLSGSKMFVYSTGAEELIQNNEYYIESIEMLDENWYYVITN